MIKKRLSAAVIIVVIALCLFGCAPSENTTQPTNPEVTSSVPPTTEKPTSEITETTNGSQDDAGGAAKIAKAIMDEIEFPDMMELPENRISLFYSLDNRVYEDISVHISEDGIYANEIAIIKIKSGQADAALGGVKDRLEGQKSDFKEYIPEQYALLEKALIKVSGDYLIFAVTEDNNKAERIFDEYI